MKWIKLIDIEVADKISLNTVCRIEISHYRICLARLADGYYAVDDQCPHAHGRLGEGKCDNEGNVLCPSHRYKYDLRTGKGKQGDYVNSYLVEKRADGLYIGFKKKWWEWF